MSSLFSFSRPVNDDIENIPSTAAVNPAQPSGLTAAAIAVPHGVPTQAEILDQIRIILLPFLPPSSSDPFPEANFAFIQVEEKPTGLGNHLGHEYLSHYAFALKGGRLNVHVRFQLWSDTPAGVDLAIDTLHTDLLMAKETLRTEGFLKMTADQSSVAEHVDSLSAWRGTAVYQILYEYYYADSDGADSLIARIPIDIATDSDDETTVVTDEMIRWDNETAPILSVQGRLTISLLSLLAFVPGDIPSNTITLTRTFDGAVGAPEIFTTLPEFITAVTDPNAPTRHAQISFSGLTAFLTALTPDGDPIIMGDWDDNFIPDNYQAYRLSFSPPLQLPNNSARLEISCQGSPLNQVAVVYVQVKR